MDGKDKAKKHKDRNKKKTRKTSEGKHYRVGEIQKERK